MTKGQQMAELLQSAKEIIDWYQGSAIPDASHELVLSLLAEAQERANAFYTENIDRYPKIQFYSWYVLDPSKMVHICSSCRDFGLNRGVDIYTTGCQTNFPDCRIAICHCCRDCGFTQGRNFCLENKDLLALTKTLRTLNTMLQAEEKNQILAWIEKYLFLLLHSVANAALPPVDALSVSWLMSLVCIIQLIEETQKKRSLCG